MALNIIDRDTGRFVRYTVQRHEDPKDPKDRTHHASSRGHPDSSSGNSLGSIPTDEQHHGKLDHLDLVLSWESADSHAAHAVDTAAAAPVATAGFSSCACVLVPLDSSMSAAVAAKVGARAGSGQAAGGSTLTSPEVWFL